MIDAKKMADFQSFLIFTEKISDVMAQLEETKIPVILSADIYKRLISCVEDFDAHMKTLFTANELVEIEGILTQRVSNLIIEHTVIKGN